MKSKTLKGKLQVAPVDYTAPGIPVSVTSLKPVMYHEGHTYLAWLDSDNIKYYGAGQTLEAAMEEFDRCYQANQPKEQPLPLPATLLRDQCCQALKT